MTAHTFVVTRVRCSHSSESDRAVSLCPLLKALLIYRYLKAEQVACGS